MNGPHDLGGAHGFRAGRAGAGRARVSMRSGSAAAAPCRSRWAPPAPGTSTWSAMRASASRPPTILRASYYEIWLKGLERILVERGLATQAEIDAGHGSLRAARPAPEGCGSGCPCDARRRAPPTSGRPPLRRSSRCGDRVRARVMNPTGHTRLPRYVRGRKGRIARIHGVHVFPDANCDWQGRRPALALFGRLRRAGGLGPGGDGRATRLPRSLGALS